MNKTINILLTTKYAKHTKQMRFVFALFACFVVTLFSSGCMSGQPVIGPLSLWSAASNEKALATRGILQSKAEMTKQDKAIRLVALPGSRPSEIAGALEVNVFDLMNGNYTWGEIGQQSLSCLGDGTLWTLLFQNRNKVKDLFGGSSADSTAAPSYTPPTQGQGGLNAQGNTAPVTQYNYYGNTAPASGATE